jgi:hypothetical protein
MDSPYLDKLAEMIDPYCKTSYNSFDYQMISLVIAYFDRYSNMKIFQLQAAGDEFFLVDNEVRLSIIHPLDIY